MDHTPCSELLELRKLANETFKRIGVDLCDLKTDNEVKVVNGSERTLKVKQLVSELHTNSKHVNSELEDIKKTILFLTDFSKLHYLLKKYKLYYIIIAIAAMGIYGVNFKELILKLLG